MRPPYRRMNVGDFGTVRLLADLRVWPVRCLNPALRIHVYAMPNAGRLPETHSADAEDHFTPEWYYVRCLFAMLVFENASVPLTSSADFPVSALRSRHHREWY